MHHHGYLLGTHLSLNSHGLFHPIAAIDSALSSVLLYYMRDSFAYSLIIRKLHVCSIVSGATWEVT